MSNNSSNENYFWMAILVFLAVVAEVANFLGLNFTTSMQVVIAVIFYALGVAAARYLVAQGYIRGVSIIPAGVVGFLACGLPAYDYWADKRIGSMAFETSTNSVLYATGWIQILIAFAIMAIGHGLINYFDQD